MAHMMPKINMMFDHLPIAGEICPLNENAEFKWENEINSLPLYNDELDKIIAHDKYPPTWTEDRIKSTPLDDWKSRQKRLFTACFQASNPWAGVARELRRRLDQNAPITNAFCKMYEMCFIDEVRSILDEHGRKGIMLKATFLAEAPALFPIAG